MSDQDRFDAATVTTSDGLDLAVFKSTNWDPARPTLLLVHGYPDNHHVYDGVVDVLVDRYNVATFDVRGTGESGEPATKEGYRLPQLVDDINRVADSLGVGKVHLVGHDWGSVQSWSAVTTDGATDRFASYTSMSGPHAEHGSHFLRSFRGPGPKLPILKQALSSLYIPVFLIPGLAEAGFKIDPKQRLVSRLEAVGESNPASSDYRTERDLRNGLQLYRQNLLKADGSRAAENTTDVPVQVLIGEKDIFVGEAIQTHAKQFASDFSVRHLPGGHWHFRSDPTDFVAAVSEFVDQRAS